MKVLCRLVCWWHITGLTDGLLVVVIDPALQQEIERLKVDLSSKQITLQTQAEEINELYAELEALRMYVAAVWIVCMVLS